ncbi:ribonuclease T2 [Choiromyces venosus 120613-1]|uniref:Ribonuclease T2-like n=1 Tax=Choiromyces venosus 120613-1 TaxID=1336337 RepID=A0A3N4JUQ9_9PEZI|nr:ribonuclease T2 [Choiromyces venosus 120613-1]
MPFSMRSIVCVLGLSQAALGFQSYARGLSSIAGTPASCSNTQISCRNTTAVPGACCFNHPGGQLLLTQFWDTNPSTGPVDAWTLHGLWPDNCDGTWEQHCDISREYTGIRESIQATGEIALLSYMDQYWKDYQGDDESLWKHEWDKHGTCINTLNTKCYQGYSAREEMIDYFQVTVDLFKTLDSYKMLAAAGITPSSTKTYTSAAIQDALTATHGFPVTIGCKNGEFNEIWYHYNVKGSLQTGEFIPTSPDGTKSTCATSGVKYLPKSGAATPTTTISGSLAPTGGVFSGSGYLNVNTGGATKGCIISAGTWYTTGTCAKFTATPSSSGFTLTSSKGNCGIASGAFSCGSGVTATVFMASGGSLAVSGSTAFYANAVPTGTTQATVYTTSKATSLTIVWQAI